MIMITYRVQNNVSTFRLHEIAVSTPTARWLRYQMGKLEARKKSYQSIDQTNTSTHNILGSKLLEFMNSATCKIRIIHSTEPEHS